MADDQPPYRVIDSEDLNRRACASCTSASIQPSLLLSRDGIPPGKEGHNIVYHHSVIVLCSSCGAGFVEVRHHDCFDAEEVWDQDEWYMFNNESGSILKEAIRGCPDPLSETCNCPVHRSLRDVPLHVANWTYGFEGEQHLNTVGVSLKNDLPVFTVQEKMVRTENSPAVSSEGHAKPPEQNREKSERKGHPNKRLEKVTNGCMIVLVIISLLSAPCVFGFWALLIIPIVLFAALICYGVGGVRESIMASAFTLGPSLVFGGIILLLDRPAWKWVALYLVMIIFGWLTSFLSHRITTKT